MAKTPMMSMRIDPDLRKRLVERGEKDGRNLSDTIRSLLARSLNHAPEARPAQPAALVLGLQQTEDLVKELGKRFDLAVFIGIAHRTAKDSSQLVTVKGSPYEALGATISVADRIRAMVNKHELNPYGEEDGE